MKINSRKYAKGLASDDSSQSEKSSERLWQESRLVLEGIPLGLEGFTGRVIVPRHLHARESGHEADSSGWIAH